ncbi:metallophosphoesterase [Sporomusa sp. KB1]|jgi:exonuclease SbcC/exonuclease SbcD|uniref:metallophosphoesterase family protein n=1 Tax=Sporomusa sp. KB1 TaxID=943346 RepID=UPI0011A5293F|nr:metallophosphoesterase [Sporomusa sp. KB1]TWH48512.1 exodeoxyribonuclease I subunit D [Sporomusa sp. KB1]
MLRIAHLADIHWGLGYAGPTPSARFEDICRVMDWVADRIIAEGCDLVIVAGDMFRKADISLDKASHEIRSAAAWLRKLTAAGLEVMVISGTPSHDPISAYDLLKDYQMPHVSIITQPAQLDIDCFDEGFSLALLPGMDRSNFVTEDDYRGQSAHVVHQMMTEHITATCQNLLNDCNYSPAILVGHLTYDLADTGFEDVLMQNEAILTTEAVQGYDLVALGHIHRPQQNGNVFYSGSPERLSFNDEKVDAGFWIHELNEGKFESQFIHTPARKFITLQLNDNGIADFVNGNIDFEDVFDDISNAIVRIRYTCSEELNRALNRKTLEKALYDAGAFFVTEIKGDIARSDRARDEEVTEAIGPVEAVRKWAENQEIDPAEISELAAMTSQLMEVA